MVAGAALTEINRRVRTGCFASPNDRQGERSVGIERRRELRRRRSRRKKCGILKRKCESANASEKVVIANKLRSLTPAADILIDRWNLEER